MKTIKFIIALLFITNKFAAFGSSIYINAVNGNDQNTGTKALPLKSINEAAKRINETNTAGPEEVILSEGIYVLTQTALFKNDKFSASNRLTIRAEYNPDDAGWSPDKMPVIVTLVPLSAGDEAKGLQMEVSHVTIEGLKFMGSPDYSYKSATLIRRSYPLWREGKSLSDLVVTQCLFAGNADILPLHVGVIANGSGLVIDHCVFFNCRNPVVYWKTNGTPSTGNAMRYCLVYQCTFSGIWTTKDTDGPDFQFENNIIAECQTAWIRERGSTVAYTIRNSILSGNKRIAGFGAGPLSATDTSTVNFLKMEAVRVNPPGSIKIEKDQSKRNYLQVADGSLGSELQTGLFKKH
jgi:hypothetical protein